MHRTVALIVVGLTGDLLGDATPNLQAANDNPRNRTPFTTRLFRTSSI